MSQHSRNSTFPQKAVYAEYSPPLRQPMPMDFVDLISQETHSPCAAAHHPGYQDDGSSEVVQVESLSPRGNAQI
ncbi:hypothetical protein GT037_002516 [Alternaria burnsii]|uniref:Uncharacterized protein n=1 Tax=Alternaria burnsii TaxID=1187904 RepID=A0A8H7EI49_9PLEO|nr:uncharacterized protein GT037_002516 [Alternaria burnsii]KAF7680865.1 hypothetical protein GT037_002516 [Alternaria burnsii]